MERLKQQFNKEITPKLKEQLGLKNSMQVPRMEKIVLSVGVGKVKEDKKRVDEIVSDLTKIAGQAPVRTKARKSIAGFKVRENQVVGMMVSLRGERMYSFLDKLINVALPRVKDFRGLSTKGFDGRGNYHIGLREHIVFPEIPGEAIEHIFGLEISLVTTAGTNDRGFALLKAFNFPFRSEDK